MLTAERERELIGRYQQGNREVAAEVIASFEPLVRSVAAGFRYEKITADDLYSEGRIGLLKALDRFDLSRGTRFAGYAREWVRAAIGDFVQKNAYSVRSGRGIARTRDIGIEEPLGEDHTFGSTLIDDHTYAPQSEVEDYDGRMERLATALATLNARERRIFEARHLEDDPLTLDVLSAELGMSRERVRQIDLRAFAKVQNAIRSGVANAP